MEGGCKNLCEVSSAFSCFMGYAETLDYIKYGCKDCFSGLRIPESGLESSEFECVTGGHEPSPLYRQHDKI